MNDLLEKLVSINAIEIRTDKTKWFRWSSGIVSPIYCDNRLTISYPKIRREISEALAKIIKENYPECEYIAGTSTAGIPHATLVSDLLNLPLVYVRGEAKKHGRQNLIEGKIEEGKKVVIVEDLISTGASLINVFHHLKEAGFEILGAVAIFSYNLKKSKTAFGEAKLKVITLADYERLLDLLEKKAVIDKQKALELLEWRDSI